MKATLLIMLADWLPAILTWRPERRSVCAGWSKSQTCWRGSRRAGQPGSSETPWRGPGGSGPPGAKSIWYLLYSTKITKQGQMKMMLDYKQCLQRNKSSPAPPSHKWLNCMTQAVPCHKVFAFSTSAYKKELCTWGHLSAHPGCNRAKEWSVCFRFNDFSLKMKR